MHVRIYACVGVCVCGCERAQPVLVLTTATHTSNVIPFLPDRSSCTMQKNTRRKRRTARDIRRSALKGISSTVGTIWQGARTHTQLTLQLVDTVILEFAATAVCSHSTKRATGHATCKVGVGTDSVPHMKCVGDNMYNRQLMTHLHKVQRQGVHARLAMPAASRPGQHTGGGQ